MKRYQRTKLAALLRALPAMRNALRNLTDQIEAESMALALLQARGAEEGEEQKLIDEHMFIIENMITKKQLLEVRVRAVERSMRALNEQERAILSAFYFEPYGRDKPIELMERFSYEKSQLYHRRGQALDRFGENYLGEIDPWCGIG